MDKFCNQCQNFKSFNNFYKHKFGKYGLRSICKICFKNNKKRYDIKNSEIIGKYQKRYQKEYRKNVLKISPRTKLSKKEKQKRLRCRKRLQASIFRARLRNRYPKWLSKLHKKELKKFYDNCPRGYHVDHIIPLNGKNICGLHVPWNLQYLTKKENLVKSNKLTNLP
jgi:hypothetical protein